MYSNNHNLLRSVGFLAILAAVTWPIWFNVVRSYKTLIPCSFKSLRSSGQEHTKGGAIVFCPPMFYMGFLEPCMQTSLMKIYKPSTIQKHVEPRSSSTTGRSWLNPEGFATRAVHLANIFVMRMLYMLLGVHTMSTILGKHIY